MPKFKVSFQTIQNTEMIIREVIKNDEAEIRSELSKFIIHKIEPVIEKVEPVLEVVKTIYPTDEPVISEVEKIDVIIEAEKEPVEQLEAPQEIGNPSMSEDEKMIHELNFACPELTLVSKFKARFVLGCLEVVESEKEEIYKFIGEVEMNELKKKILANLPKVFEFLKSL